MDDGENTHGLIIKAKRILAVKANVVLHLIEAMDGNVRFPVSPKL